MLVPEKGQNVKKWVLPARLLQIAVVAACALALLCIFLMLNYLQLLTQVAENKKLRLENQKLSQSIQSSQNNLETLDLSVQRLKDFSRKLRTLGNLGEPGMSKIMSAPDDFQNPLSTDDDQSKTKKTKKNGDTSQIDDVPYQEDNINPSLNDIDYEALAIQDQAKVGSTLGIDYTILQKKPLQEQLSDITVFSKELVKISREEEKNFANLYEHLQDRVDRLTHTPSIQPALGWLSSRFGWRHNPFVGKKTFHAGLDVANKIGTPIFSPADGVVRRTGAMGSFGLVVIIDHGYNMMTKYAHTSKVYVQKGQKIKRGEKIAAIGSTGRSTGPHLHYQVEVAGKPVDPESFILDNLL